MVRVKVRLVLPFSGMLGAPNTLLSVAGFAWSTVKLAVAWLPPEQSQTMGLVTLVCNPSASPVTVTENVQEYCGGKSNRVSVTEPATVSTTTALRSQVPVVTLDVGMAKPAGRVSVNRTAHAVSVEGVPVSGFVLVRLKVRLVLPCAGMCAAPNALVKVIV